MPIDYRPVPHHTQPGSPPLPGQFTSYVDDDGNEYPAIITFVGETSPDGKLVNVAARRVKPSGKQLAEDPSKLGNPVADEQNGWLYNIEHGRVYYCPCGPPYPACCPCP